MPRAAEPSPDLKPDLTAGIKPVFAMRSSNSGKASGYFLRARSKASSSLRPLGTCM